MNLSKLIGLLLVFSTAQSFAFPLLLNPEKMECKVGKYPYSGGYDYPNYFSLYYNGKEIYNTLGYAYSLNTVNSFEIKCISAVDYAKENKLKVIFEGNLKPEHQTFLTFTSSETLVTTAVERITNLENQVTTLIKENKDLEARVKKLEATK